jgi:hypothetical protein
VVDALDDVSTADAIGSRARGRDAAAFTADPTEPAGGLARRGVDVGADFGAGASTDGAGAAASTLDVGGAVADARSNFAPNMA